MSAYNYNAKKSVGIINEIIEMENAARELVKGAQRENDGLQKKISESLEEYKAAQKEDAQKQIDAVRAAEEAAAKQKAGQIYMELEQKLEKLKKITAENIDMWVEEIYSAITAPTALEKEKTDQDYECI